MATEEQLALFDLPEPKSQAHSFKPLRRTLWTEHKAKLIERYLYYFVLITRHGVYIDGFAGPQKPNQPDSWAAKLVLESEPRWLRNFFLCDRDPKQIEALERLRDEQPDVKGRTIEVFGEDFNKCVDQILRTERITEKTAAFCLLDQRAFECEWATVEKIAARKRGRKVELFYFVPTGWLNRSISGLRDFSVIERWWGKEDWRALHQANNHQKIEMFCQRFKDELGYDYAHAWPIYDRQGSQRIMYHMVHATNHPEAPNLMARAYRNATGRKEPLEQLKLEFESWAQSRGIRPEIIRDED